MKSADDVGGDTKGGHHGTGENTSESDVVRNRRHGSDDFANACPGHIPGVVVVDRFPGQPGIGWRDRLGLHGRGEHHQVREFFLPLDRRIVSTEPEISREENDRARLGHREVSQGWPIDGASANR